MVLIYLIFGRRVRCTRSRLYSTSKHLWMTRRCSCNLHGCDSHAIHDQAKHNGFALHLPINNLISLWNVLRATIRITVSKVLNRFDLQKKDMSVFTTHTHRYSMKPQKYASKIVFYINLHSYFFEFYFLFCSKYNCQLSNDPKWITFRLIRMNTEKNKVTNDFNGWCN